MNPRLSDCIRQKRSAKTRVSQVATGMFHFPFENKINMAARASQRKGQYFDVFVLLDCCSVMTIISSCCTSYAMGNSFVNRKNQLPMILNHLEPRNHQWIAVFITHHGINESQNATFSSDTTELPNLPPCYQEYKWDCARVIT